MSQTLRSILVVFAGGAALVLVLDRFVKSPDFRFPKDFLEYWGSGWLNLHGENPYDGEKLLAVQRSEQPDREHAVMMWNPPPSLAVYMPLGLMGAAWASILWLCLQFAAIMLACHWLWKLYGPDTPSRVRSEAVPATAKGSWLPALAGFACVGTWWVIGYGQNTGLLALGLAGYLYYTRSGKPITAGAFAALTALKPHLLAGFGVLLLADAATRRGRIALASGAGVVALSLGLALAANPAVVRQFLDALRNPGPEAVPLNAWMLPVPSYWLRDAIDYNRFWIQFVPCAAACIALLAWRLREGRSWDWVRAMPLVVAISILTTPYGGWIFDLPILVVPMMWCTARIAHDRERLFMFLAAQAAITAISFAIPSKLHNYWWVAPASLALCLLGLLRTPASNPLVLKCNHAAREPAAQLA